MKTIGLIGGMSWESTTVYYQHLNRLARERLGGLHSAQLLLWSFDFAEIEQHQASGDWTAATAAMVKAAHRLQQGGAECLVICTNTMHKMAEEVKVAVGIPLIHIADATAAAIQQAQLQKPLLLATRYTMEQDFYKGLLRQGYGLDVRVPDAGQRTVVHDIIYEELCRGVFSSASREKILGVADQAIDRGADSIIFGCTEVGMLVSPKDCRVPAFDSTLLHAEAALNYALS